MNNFQEPIFPASRKNEFLPGDIVEHPESGRKGEVAHVWKKWVRFRVVGETAPGGAALFVKHPHTKLRVLVSRRERAAASLHQLAAQMNPATAPKPTLWQKVKAFWHKVKAFFGKKH